MKYTWIVLCSALALVGCDRDQGTAGSSNDRDTGYGTSRSSTMNRDNTLGTGTSSTLTNTNGVLGVPTTSPGTSTDSSTTPAPTANPGTSGTGTSGNNSGTEPKQY